MPNANSAEATNVMEPTKAPTRERVIYTSVTVSTGTCITIAIRSVNVEAKTNS